MPSVPSHDRLFSQEATGSAGTSAYHSDPFLRFVLNSFSSLTQRLVSSIRARHHSLIVQNASCNSSAHGRRRQTEAPVRITRRFP